MEFGEKGFDGASTRSIAQRANAHQPQINYHFASKEALWFAAVDHLFGLLGQAMAGVRFVDAEVSSTPLAEADPHQLALGFADVIGRLVAFAAAHPELNRIMVHEGTAAGDRLTWITETHVAPLYRLLQETWTRLRAAGIAAPIDASMVHYVLVGAASLPYVNAPEARLLTGVEPTDPERVAAYAEGLVATLLPGLAPGDRPGRPTSEPTHPRNELR